MEEKFVFLKKEYSHNGIMLPENEIGIIANQNENSSTVKFVNLDNSVEIETSLLEDFDPRKTGDQFERKVCNICNRLLPVSEFQKNQTGKDNRTVRRPSCNECRKSIDGKGLSAKDRKEWEEKKPNYIIWECPICKKRTIPGLTSKIVLDHDHATGEPRAWICDSCNTGLGRFKDDIQFIENAIKYLKDT